MPEAVVNLERSLRLVTGGWLPGWVGLVAFAALGWFAVHQLRREFAGVKTGFLVRRALPGIRLLIVATLIWLACRPSLQVLSRWGIKPVMLIQLSGQRSMDVREEFGSLYEKIDALEVVENAMLPRRNRAASRLARSLETLAAACADAEVSLKAQLGSARTGLPLGPGFAREVARLRESLSGGLDELAAYRADLPTELEDESLQEAVALVAHRTDLVLSGGLTLETEADVVSREAPRHPDLLEQFAAKVSEAAHDAQTLGTDVRDLQSRLDAALLGQAVLESFRTRAVTRRSLAEKAADIIGAHFAGEFGVAIQTSSDMAAGLGAAFQQSLASPIAGVIYIGDGSTGLDERARRALEDLALAAVPVHAVLIGKDGVRPADIGLVSVDVPPTVEAGRPVTARALVQNALPPERNPRLLVRSGSATLATKGILPGKDPTTVVEVSLLFESPGRHALAFEVLGEGKDAYSGNERFLAVVDVLPQGRRALIVSDRLAAGLAAYQHVLKAGGQLQVEIIVAEPAMGPVKVGSDPGEFPGQAGDWQGVALAVLLGGVPQGLPDTALDALREAIEDGLHVLVHAGAAPPGQTRWAPALGLDVSPARAPRKPTPVNGHWAPLYALGRSEKESMDLWRDLPMAEDVWTISTPALTLLECDAGAVAGTVFRGSGVIVYNGLGNLGSLRAGGNERAVNRLLHGLIHHALRSPWELLEGGERVVLWPAQPVVGKRLSLGGLAHPPAEVSGLRAVGQGPAGEWIYEVLDADHVEFSVNGSVFRRQVHSLLGPQDFALTPRADVLAQMSKATGGRHMDLVDMTKLFQDVKAEPVRRSSVSDHRLWTGWWPLVLVLALVSAEYLLRRRAGRVM